MNRKCSVIYFPSHQVSVIARSLSCALPSRCQYSLSSSFVLVITLGTDRRRLNDDRSSSFSLPFCPLMLDHALTSDSADPLGYRLLLADRRGKVRASGGRHWSGSRRRRARSFRGVRGAVVGVQSVPVDGRRIGRTPGDCAARHLCHHQASLSLLLRHVG